jgi:hypothetical protein
MIVLIFIVLAISIYMKNSYYVEGVENMFNDKGQFSDFILPEYSQTSPLTQLTETIFYDKTNGNIVEAVVEWKAAEVVAPTPEVVAPVPEVVAPVPEVVAPVPEMVAPVPEVVAPVPEVVAPVPEVVAPVPEVTAPVPEETVPTTTEGHENMTQTPTLKRLIITPRSGSDSYIYDITNTAECIKKPTQESLIDKIEPSYSSWSYISQSEFAPETTVFYMPWKNDTYLTVYEKSDSKMTPKGLFYFTNGNTGMVDIKQVELSNYVNTQDDNNNKYVKDAKYGDYDLYQLDKYVLYDIPTSNLVIRKEHNTGSINILNGIGDTITPTTVKDMYEANKTHENQDKYSELKAWTTIDGQGENTVLYIKNADKTLVASYGFESSKMDSLVLKNVKRFTLYGVDMGDKIEKPATSACDKKAVSDTVTEKPKVEEATSDDYILKTKIVPPVCPSCPMCPDKVTCTNCGGSGGSGTIGLDGKSMVKDEKVVTKTKVVDQAGNVISETVGEVTGLARDAVGGGVGLAKDAVGGTVGLAKDAVGGTVGLAKDAVGGTVGLAREIVGGVSGLIRGAGSGAVNLLTPGQQFQSQQSGRGASTQSIGTPEVNYGTNNYYSHYGLLPNKESNFVPRTANFSNFA